MYPFIRIEMFNDKCLPLWKFFSIVPSYALKLTLTKKIVDAVIAPNIQLRGRLIGCGSKMVRILEHFVDSPLKQPDILQWK